MGSGMLDRRFIVLVAAGAGLAASYRRGIRVNHDDLSGWYGFLTVWLPAALILGVVVTFVWPWAAGRWQSRRRDGR